MINSLKTINESIQSIQNTLEKTVNLVKYQMEETIRWNPSEEEWSILQILSHLNEAVPYWLNEIQTVVSAPGSGWGRGLQDPMRLAAVTDTDKLSVEEEIEKVELLKEKVFVGLSGLDGSTLAQENPHRNFAEFGSKPVSFMIEHFIEEHIEGHYNQINRNLSKIED